MNEVQQKWNHVFHIDDKVKEPRTFLLLKDFVDQYIALQRTVSINHDNTIQINELVTIKTKDISDKLEQSETSLSKLQKSKEYAETTLSYKEAVMEEQIKNNQSNIESAITTNNESHRKETDALKKHMESLETDKLELRSQLSVLNTISARLDKKSESSFAKGVEGEKDLLTLLRDDGSFKVEDTHGQQHKGDALITLNNKTYCIDSKNHTSFVPSDDVDKLLKDIELNNYDGGAIIAWKTHIYDPTINARIREGVIIKIISGKPILFVSHAHNLSSAHIISLLKMLEQHIQSEESIQHSKNYDKLQEACINIIEKEETALETEHNIFIRSYKKRKRYLKSLKDIYNIDTPNDGDVVDDSLSEVSMLQAITSIDELITIVATKHTDKKGQRNSTHDIKQFLEHYCTKHNHTLNTANRNQLNDILLSLGYQSENKYGKNYQDKIRKKESPTWAITLSPDLLN